MAIPKLRFPEFRDDGEWDAKNLGDVCDILQGYGFPEAMQGKSKGKYPFCKVSDITRSVNEKSGLLSQATNYIDSDDLVKLKAKTIPIATTVFAKIGEALRLNRRAITTVECLIDNNVTGLKAKQNFSNDYFIFILSQKIDLNEYCGGAVPSVNKTTLENIEVFIPKISEQQKIADCLSSLDDLITAETQKLDSLKAHKKGLMQQLFPAEGETIPTLRFPEFREAGAWEEKKLGDFGEFKNGINFSADKKGSGILTVDVLNMYGPKIETQLDSLYRVDLDSKDYLLEDCDILFVRSSMKREGIGWTSLFRRFSEPVLYCGFLIRLRLKSFELTNPEFLLYYLRSDYGRTKIISISGTAAITNISQDSLKIIPVPIPTLKEQQKIAGCLSSLDDLITTQMQKIEALKLHKKGLMQQLFPSVE